LHTLFLTLFSTCTLFIVLSWLSHVIRGKGCSNLEYSKVLASTRRFNLGIACMMGG
jgi:hypothetical protein